MKRLMLFATAASALALSGCADEFGIGLGNGYGNGYSDYGYSDGYAGYGADSRCIAYDQYGRAYYTCNSYYGGYGYSPQRTIYYYPGYSYSQGYYYDQQRRRYDGQSLYAHRYGEGHQWQDEHRGDEGRRGEREHHGRGSGFERGGDHQNRDGDHQGNQQDERH
jgi:hypothetical protein